MMSHAVLHLNQRRKNDRRAPATVHVAASRGAFLLLLLAALPMLAAAVPVYGGNGAVPVYGGDAAPLGSDDSSSSSSSSLTDNQVITMMSQLPLGPYGGAGDGPSSSSRRLQQAAAGAKPLAAFHETLSFNAPVISIALTHVPAAGPRSRKYFAYWRPWNDTMTKSAATFDLDSRQVNFLTTKFNQFCNGPIVLPNGNTALFGGWDVKTKVQVDGRKAISVYSESNKKLSNVGNMSFSRWYPTPCLTADNKVLIVGGTAFADKGPKIPVAELWDPAKPANTPLPVPLPPSFAAASWYNWYPFIALLPGGEMLWWGDRGGSITDQDWKEIYTFPPLPDSFPYRTMYWFTSSIVLNALKPNGNGEYNSWSMTIFGGAPADVTQTSPASPVSARLDMSYCGSEICDKGWVIEDMAGQRRVMPTTTVLPNGKVLVHGGGQAGRAGWKKGKNGYQSILPAHQDLVYDPDARQGSRYSLSGTVGIIRMYHAASCLDLSGKVLSSGCETCGMTGDQAKLPTSVSRSPNGDLDYRLSFAVPAEIGASVRRPAIVSAPGTIRRGSTFNVRFTNGPITGATLAAPCSNTHSINMNQRVLFLNVASTARGVATIRAPPLSQPAAAHPGYYMLFLLGETTTSGRTYSEGIWVNLVN